MPSGNQQARFSKRKKAVKPHTRFNFLVSKEFHSAVKKHCFDSNISQRDYVMGLVQQDLLREGYEVDYEYAEVVDADEEPEFDPDEEYEWTETVE